MTKKLRIILVTIVAIIALLVTYTVRANNVAQDNNNKSLWQLVDKMNWLRDLKQECSDNLNITDSAKFLMWETWYCDSWDAEIVELRNQISQLQKKDYETARGLIKSRQAQ